MLYSLSFEEAIAHVSSMLTKVKLTHKEKYALLMSKHALEKQTPKAMIVKLKQNNKASGDCPTCNGILLVEQSFMRKHKGFYCDWCGQRIDYDAINWSTE